MEWLSTRMLTNCDAVATELMIFRYCRDREDEFDVPV